MYYYAKQCTIFYHLLSVYRIYRARLLLQAGVDVNSGDNAESDNKVLHWAASFADVATLRLLLGSFPRYLYTFDCQRNYLLPFIFLLLMLVKIAIF